MRHKSYTTYEICLLLSSAHWDRMNSFDLQFPTRIVFAPGAIEQLGQLAVGLDCKRVLVVSDKGVVKAGHFEAGAQSLRSAGLVVDSFHDFGENPTTDMVEAGLKFASDFRPDLLVGLGGGSSLDCCKGINFVYSCGGVMRDYHGVGKATCDLLPMIAVPTTSGTGSESQSFALISDSETHVKMACGDKRAACKIALLDPKLTVTQPPRVTALTGIDALSHAIETYVSRKRTPISTTFSRQAFGWLANGFPIVLHDPTNLEARAQMQLGACFAGLAIETSMLGAAHATANPLTARHDVTHGQAVGLMLPAVIRMNGKRHASWYAELLRELEPVTDVEAAPNRLAEIIEAFLEAAGLATSFQQLNIPTEHIPDLASEALHQWTGTFNPVPLDHDSVQSLYREVS